MSKARKIVAITFASLLLGSAAAAYAAPPPPSPGNGGGNSGQCTGDAKERPGNACQSGNK